MPLKFANPASDPDEFFDQNGSHGCAVCRGRLIPQSGPFGVWHYCPWDGCQEALTNPYGREAKRMRRQDSLFQVGRDENQLSIFG